MCSGVTRSRFNPGKHFGIITKGGMKTQRWGFFNGQSYNVRYETMVNTWKDVNKNRGILTVESFWEAGTEFADVHGKLLNIAVLYSAMNEFAIVTVESCSVVKPFHKRMPLVVPEGAINEYMAGSLSIQSLDNFVVIGGRKAA